MKLFEMLGMSEKEEKKPKDKAVAEAEMNLEVKLSLLKAFVEAEEIESKLAAFEELHNFIHMIEERE